jgi:aldehyde dehydrogenase (NAD+)
MIERAKLSGRMLIGGDRPNGELGKGYYIKPTLFADVDPASELAQTEVFGPVVAMIPFDSEEEAVRIANSTHYGLASYIHTNDLRRAHRVAEQIDSGGVYINGGATVAPNTPYGGLGLSGFGREGGRPGIEEFLRHKTVAIG